LATRSSGCSRKTRHADAYSDTPQNVPGTQGDPALRLVSRSNGAPFRSQQGALFRQPGPEHVVTTSPVGECREHMLHYSFSGLAPLLDKLNRYKRPVRAPDVRRGAALLRFDLTLRPSFAFFKT